MGCYVSANSIYEHSNITNVLLYLLSRKTFTTRNNQEVTTRVVKEVKALYPDALSSLIKGND